MGDFSITQRLHQVDNSKYWRTQNNTGKDVSWFQLANLGLTTVLAVFVTGFFLIGPGLDGVTGVELSDDVETFETYNYTIHYVPEDEPPLEGNTRGTYFHGDGNEFYVEQGHSLGTTPWEC